MFSADQMRCDNCMDKGSGDRKRMVSFWSIFCFIYYYFHLLCSSDFLNKYETTSNFYITIIFALLCMRTLIIIIIIRLFSNAFIYLFYFFTKPHHETLFNSGHLHHLHLDPDFCSFFLSSGMRSCLFSLSLL